MTPPAPPAVLRPALFARLKARFPAGVKVANAGVRMSSMIEVGASGLPRRVCDPVRFPTHTPGEFYRVCCCYCHETRFRLYINHRWGYPDPDAGGSQNLWLVTCMNNDCVRGYDQQRALYEHVYAIDTPGLDDFVREGSDGPVALGGPVSPPGTVLSLGSLPDDHPARRYLVRRGYDPDVLSDAFGVGYVFDPPDDLTYLRGRLYLPVHRDGELVGYQCRYVGEPPTKATPKYLFSRGFPRSSTLYNLDRAKGMPFVCLLEGATKVWRFGPEAVGSFGKEVTGHQVHLLSRHWERIVVMLDPNARKKGEALFSVLKGIRPQTVLVDLPDGVEPDNVTTAEARRFAFDAAAAAGVDLLAGGGP